MFNSPRPGVRYSTTLSADNNPLAASTASAFDVPDPWSAAPSPVHTPPPPAVPQVFSNVIADAMVPPVYGRAFEAAGGFAGEVGVGALSRVLGTARLPAATVDRIVNLVSTRPTGARVSKLEFFIALALVALAQSGKDLSIEHVAALAAQNSLPAPTLDLQTLAPPSTFSPARQDAASDDPWSSAFRTRAPNGTGTGVAADGTLPAGWSGRLEQVSVAAVGQQGFLLGRHMVYSIACSRGTPVQRRYSEFVYLWDCLVRRYPFRVLPPLPPKRIGPDANFLEQRRRGLARWLNFVVNHPVLKEDGILGAFLTEISFEEWRKHASVTLEEESASKRVDRVDEMGIPSDLEDKLKVVAERGGLLIEQWQRICVVGERMVRRRESAAADLARVTMTLQVLAEAGGECWRGAECELCGWTRAGLGTVARHTQVAGDMAEQRMGVLGLTTLEAFKSQRDLYVGLRDLFVRHERQSGDDVERIKKRVVAASERLEAIKSGQREGWTEEADRVIGGIERDQATISGLLARRVFIRHCMWEELRVVVHNRENTLLVEALQRVAHAESEYTERVHENWTALGDALDEMT